MSTGKGRRTAVRATWALLVVGLLAAPTLATESYSSARSRAAESFRGSAKSLYSALATAVRRDTDFVAFQQGLLQAFPGIDNRQYFTAIGGKDLSSRYPGGLGFDFIERVPRRDLGRFAALVARDPIPGTPPIAASHFTPFPAGERLAYCLSRVGWSTGALRQQDLALVGTFDYCAPLPTSPFPAALIQAARSATTVAVPPMSIYPGVFFVVAPVYRGVAPLTDAQREAELAGWVLGTFSGPGTLRAALGNLEGFRVSLSYARRGGRPVTLASLGSARGGGQYTSSFAAAAGGRWLISVSGGVGPSAASQAALEGALVACLTILLFAFVRLLARSRERALALVELKTGELRHQALHDTLTGLPNRTLVSDRANQMLARARREPTAVGALFVDIDNFKEVNDSFGHPRGDQLLRAVAERLMTAVRPSDTVGRLGGDEFVVLVEGNSLDAGADVVAQRLLDVLSEPFVLDGMDDVPLAVRVSIGVATGVRASADELLRDADVALYQAKRAGKGRCTTFRPEMQVAVQDRLSLEIDLRRALESEEQLYVEYQPIFELGTAEMVGAEALARWRHPERGQVGPDTFIPVAEESGLIIPVGRLVLQKSCRQAAEWASAGLGLPVSVNVSGRQLQQAGFPNDVAAALVESGLPAEMLTLELTETVLMHDADTVAAQLAALKELGVKLAIDDFGTGYSSFTYLRRFPVDSLKIDRSFIAGVAHSAQASAIVQSLVQLGKKLGLDVVAEGIEEPAQVTKLREQRCDLGQGFVYSRPVAAGELESLWGERAGLAPAPR